MRILRSFFFVCALGVLFTADVLAAGIGVKPLRTELFVAPGATKSATITVINGEQTPVKAEPTIEVYTKNDESGFPVSIDLEPDDPRNIESWISFSEDVTSLEGDGEAQVEITVTVPEDAEPGGRYAAVLYEPVIENDGQGVQIRSRVASLLLITVSGEQRRAGEVQDFELSPKVANDTPITFDIRFENTGNVHLSPKGTVTLTDSNGQKLTQVARYLDRETGQEVVADEIPANPNGGNVLPGSMRVFEAGWNENKRPGTYTAELSLTFPGSTEPIVMSTDVIIEEDFEITDLTLVGSPEEGYSFELSVRNDGTILEKPVGTLAVTNEFDYVVKEIEMPEDLEYTSPGESKIYTIPFMNKELPKGQYTATLSLKQGVTGETIQKVMPFGTASISWVLILSILGGIGVVVVLVSVLKKK